MALSIGKWQISTPQASEPILMKLGMVDINSTPWVVQDLTLHDNFGGGIAVWVVWANM